jgi:hypothetical protein
VTATPSTATAGAVSLSWNAVNDTGVAGGNVVLFECSIADDCNTGSWTANPADLAPWTRVDLSSTATSTSFQCGVVVSCVFRVGYVDGAGNISGVSNSVIATGIDAPTLTATAGNAPGKVDLSWTPPSTSATIASYQIDRDTGSGFVHLASVGPFQTTYADTLCTPGASCGYRVRALYTLGTSAYSTAQYVTAPPAALSIAAATAFNLDTTAPTVTITTPTSPATTSTTPTISGTRGTAPGDLSTVTILVYGGSDTSGSLVETLTDVNNTSAFSVMSATLAAGTYTVQASQSDTVGNVGLSAPVTFAAS